MRNVRARRTAIAKAEDTSAAAIWTVRILAVLTALAIALQASGAFAKGAPDTFDIDGYAAALFRCRHDVGHDVFVPGFERSLEQPIAAARVVAASARLVLTEGNYLLHDADGWDQVHPLLAECWYVDLADDVRRQRLVARHVLFGKAPDEAVAWVETVDEPNARLVADGRARADLVIAS